MAAATTVRREQVRDIFRRRPEEIRKHVARFDLDPHVARVRWQILATVTADHSGRVRRDRTHARAEYEDPSDTPARHFE